MAYYNPYYSYPDLFLWKDETWAQRKSPVAVVYVKLQELLEKQRAQQTEVDFYENRHDEIRDELNLIPYFPDVIEYWKQKGLSVSSSGMMGLQAVPLAVERQEIYEPKVLLIPYLSDRKDPHEGMNLLKKNAEALEIAASENILVQFQDCFAGTTGAVVEKVIETQGTFRIRYAPVYLDISLLEKYGLTLADVPGLDVSKWSDPVTLAGRIVVEITDKWQVSLAHQHEISVIYQQNQPKWDFDRHIRSMAGKRQAEAMALEYRCVDPHDPEMESFFKERGIRYEDHYHGTDWYVTLTPECAFKKPTEKLPLLIVMKEPRTAFPGVMQTAFQFYYDFIEICGRGEFMMLYFALETPWDNEKILPRILAEAFAEYPVDQSRVYLTGQSHNGYYALEFYRKHPKLIAATATLSDPVGLQAGARIDYYLKDAEKIIADFQKYDYPLIDINGNLENSYCDEDRTPEREEKDIMYFQNRLKAFKLPMRSREEILAARTSRDYATRRNGVPADRTEVRYVMGSEVYLSDFYRADGKCYFRYISLENTPHMIMPQMAELSWEFLRRFARNTETGEVIERY